MLRKLPRGRPSHATVVAYLALFVALGGTSAWATHEVINSSDVVNESLTGADIKNGTLTGTDVFDNTIGGADVTNGSLTGADIFDNTIGGADITNGSLTGADVADNTIGVSDIGSQQVGSDEVLNDSLLTSDIRSGAVASDEVFDNSLTGTDINESTLAPTTTATFGTLTASNLDDTFRRVGVKSLPAGSYAVIATANTNHGIPFAGDQVRDVVCELRNGTSFIGGAADRRVLPDGDRVDPSLSMSGGAQVPAGGGEVSMWCRAQGVGSFNYGTMMIIRLDGFF
jgi:hypothetical protein